MLRIFQDAYHHFEVNDPKGVGFIFAKIAVKVIDELKPRNYSEEPILSH